MPDNRLIHATVLIEHAARLIREYADDQPDNRDVYELLCVAARLDDEEASLFCLDEDDPWRTPAPAVEIAALAQVLADIAAR